MGGEEYTEICQKVVPQEGGSLAFVFGRQDKSLLRVNEIKKHKRVFLRAPRLYGLRLLNFDVPFSGLRSTSDTVTLSRKRAQQHLETRSNINTSRL